MKDLRETVYIETAETNSFLAVSPLELLNSTDYEEKKGNARSLESLEISGIEEQ